MKLILGKKLGMMQIFDKEAGRAIPVSLVEAGPVIVTALKTRAKDGYAAVQIGFGKKKSVKKPQKKIGSFRILKEFRVLPEQEGKFNLGDEIKAEIFSKGEKVNVIGISKGRGFAGVVKRHGFRGGPKSHGQKHRLRAPGSIGATTPQRVIKGTRMGGHMGASRVNTKGLEVIEIDTEKNIIFLKGAIPGYSGSLVEIRSKK